jgi:hypothetical protein
VFHRSEPLAVPSRHRTSAAASYHVGLDTMMGRRSRRRPDEVTIDGFLLLDTGEYELVVAHVPLEVFWRMKALDVVGHVRTANQARAARPRPYPHVGSVWLVDGDLEAPAPGSGGTSTSLSADECDLQLEPPALGDGAPTKDEPKATETAERIFRLRVHAVHCLDRVALEASGPRTIETFDVRDMLPKLSDD